MAELDLKRVLRGATKSAVERVAGLIGPVRVENSGGRVLVGEEGAGENRHPVVYQESEVGAVFGPERAVDLAELIGFLYEREIEKRELATETLARYKELALLYDLGDTLSRVVGVEEVAQTVVDEAVTFMKSGCAAILLLDRRKERLESVAAVGKQVGAVRVEDAEVCMREALQTARAGFVTGDDHSSMCAPLRSGEEVFGVLWIANDHSTTWTAGDLKLLASLAAKAADGITRALLHRAQMQEQALRGQIQRFVSADLLPAANSTLEAVPLLYCDLGQAARSVDTSLSHDELGERLEIASTIALGLMLDFDVTVNIAHGEMLIAIFGGTEFETAAAQAVEASVMLSRALSEQVRGNVNEPVGLVVVGAPTTDPQDFLAAVGAAATLQAANDGRILLHADIAPHAHGLSVSHDELANSYEVLL